MSFSEKRAAIAAALSTVPDCTGHQRRPSAPAIGDAWPVWGGNKRAQGSAFLVAWRVRVLLPQDEDAASTWMDAHWDLLFYALEPCGFTTTALPVMLATTAGDMYALEITLTAEE